MRSKKFYFQITALAITLLPCLSYAQSDTQSIPVIKDLVEISGVKDRTSAEVLIPLDLQDLSGYIGISARIANTGNNFCRIEGYINDQLWINSCIYLYPGEMKTIEILMKRLQAKGTEDFPAIEQPAGVDSLWHWDAVDPEKIEKVSFMVFSDDESSVKIVDIRPFGDFIPSEEFAGKEDFFPFIDHLGQYKYDDWPGKIKDVKEFEKKLQQEQQELSLLPGPEGCSRFGGWLSGGKL